MTTQSVFIGNLDLIKVRCPRCNIAKSIPVNKLNSKHEIKARCKCNNVFKIKFEYRKKFRKPIELDGHFSIVDINTDIQKINKHVLNVFHQYPCKVINLSSHGIGFTAIKAQEIRKGHVIRIIFKLDNSTNTSINKIAVVKVIKDIYFGCEFVEPEKDDPAIGFYLL